MGESTYRTDSSITPIDYTDEDEDFVDEGEYIEELEEQINALKEELKLEKQQGSPQLSAALRNTCPGYCKRSTGAPRSKRIDF